MDIFQGFIAAFGFNYPPRDWVWCAGQMVSIDDNMAMYSLLGSFYGGDDRTVFGMPELRGRSPIGYGQSPGQPSYNMGQRVGATTNILSLDQMPKHNHQAAAVGGGAEIAGGVYVSTANGRKHQCDVGDYLATTAQDRTTTYMTYISPADKGSIVPLGGIDLDVSYTNPSVVTDDEGGDNSFSVMQPVIAVNFSIALHGLYPPRN